MDYEYVQRNMESMLSEVKSAGKVTLVLRHQLQMECGASRCVRRAP